MLALAAAAACAALVVYVRDQSGAPGDLPAVRPAEARFAYLRWAPWRVGRGAAGADFLQNAVMAQTLVRKTEGGSDRGSLQARALASVILDRVPDAVADLTRAAEGSTDPAIWNDVAAAYHAEATTARHPIKLSFALAAADRALRLRPDFAPAKFNRALIVEHLGDAIGARRAWAAYLATDSQSEWATEAREHLRALDDHASPDFNARLGRARDALARGDASLVEQLVADEPQDTRTWAEAPILDEWARATLHGDVNAASAELSAARAVGEALCRRKGECLLADAVAVVVAATGDRQRTAALAEAYRTYADGRLQYSRRRLLEGERYLRRAAALFESARSPMAAAAHYFTANTIFDQNRTAEARAILIQLLDTVDRGRHQALHAQLLWQLARCEIVDGRWSAASRACDTSRQIFATLGERRNEARVTALAADAYEYVADPETAWSLRVAALQVLSRGNHRAELRSVLANATRGAIRAGHADVALSLIDLSVEHLREANDPLLLADAMVQRARIAAATSDRAVVAEALRTARAAIGTISDRPLRERAAADLAVAEGVFLRRSDGGRAVAALAGAIDFYAGHGYDAWLVDAHLQRARAYVATGDRTRALSDYAAAMDELEHERGAVASQHRTFFFDREPALFEETVGLLLNGSRFEEALQIAERGRARTLREQLALPAANPHALSVEDLHAALPARTVLLELAFTPDGIAIFCITPRSFAAVSVPVARDAVRSAIGAQRSAIQNDAPMAEIERLGSALHDLLLVPVQQSLAGADQIVFVCDRELETIPWAAVRNRVTGRFLMEDFAISLAPSAAIFAATASRSPAGRTLIVGNPAAPGRESLRYAEREAASLARLYSDVTVLLSRRATRSAFVQAAQASSLIHVASHAQSSDRGDAAILLAPDSSGGDGNLTAFDIARLQLPRTALVVLAACGTARGRATHVEGMPSLARAFLSAGVPAVVGTRWDIDDRGAAVVFAELHARLAAGDSPARALQRARLSAMRSNDASARRASTWAAIEVLGKATGGD